MERENARLPIKSYPVGEEVFYVNNTLVHELDGNRILGLLTPEELATKREQYEAIVGKLPEEQRQEHPFIVYKLTRIE